MLVDRTKENLERCKCLSCPSYTLGCKVKNVPVNLFKMMEDLDKVEHFEQMFCAFEKSHCIDEDRGCLCPECPVHAEYNLNRDDYCLRDGGKPEDNCVAGFDSEDFNAVEKEDKNLH